MTEKKMVKKTSDVPAYLLSDDLGTEDITSEDIQIPRLKIIQGTSEIKQKYPKKFRDGEMYNTVTNENYGDEVSFFVIQHWKSTIWFSEDFKLIGVSYFNKKTRTQEILGNDIQYCKDNPQEGKLSHNYLIVLKQDIEAGNPTPIIFSCMSASISAARQLNGRLKANAARKIPIYAQLIKMKTDLKKFQKGSAYMPVFEYVSFATKPEFNLLQHSFESAKSLLDNESIHTIESEENEVSEDSKTKLAEKKIVNSTIEDITEDF